MNPYRDSQILKNNSLKKSSNRFFRRFKRRLLLAISFNPPLAMGSQFQYSERFDKLPFIYREISNVISISAAIITCALFNSIWMIPLALIIYFLQK